MADIKELVKRYRLSRVLNAPLGLERYCVRGEVKPHNAEGILGGLRQLWDTKNTLPGVPKAVTCPPVSLRTLPGSSTGSRTLPVLITYEADSANPQRFHIRAFGGLPLALLLAGGRPRRSPLSTDDSRWQSLGWLNVPQASDPIPLRSCSTLLGNLMEGVIRREYAAAMRKVHTPALQLHWRDPSQKGADILHEEWRAFVTELESELSRAF